MYVLQFLDVIDVMRYLCCAMQIAGRGVFASKQIAAGQFICEYYGELISGEEGDARENAKPSCFCYYQAKTYW